MLKRLLVASASAFTLTVSMAVAVGCGGTAHTKSTGVATQASATTTVVSVSSGTPLKRSVWIAKGDAICRHMNAQLDSTVVKTEQEYARALAQAVIYERAGLTQLATLVPPSSERELWHEMLEDAQHWSEGSAKLSTEAQTGSFSLTSPVAAATKSSHEGFARLAHHAGFKICSVA